jgi:hypothetical protein
MRRCRLKTWVDESPVPSLSIRHPDCHHFIDVTNIHKWYDSNVHHQGIRRMGRQSALGAPMVVAASNSVGLGAAGISAGLNYRRLGRPRLMWPTTVISSVVFIGVPAVLAFVDRRYVVVTAIIINAPAALTSVSLTASRLQ